MTEPVGLRRVSLLICLVAWRGLGGLAQNPTPPATSQVAGHSEIAIAGFAGFDKNNYPGDDLLAELRRQFAFTGYWLNNPPGMTSNQWAGKRALLQSHGFGFAVLFNGRLDADLKGKDAAALGRSDASAAIEAAAREGFPAGAILFLDQEEGGHLLPEQANYLFSWIDAIAASDYRPGVYCSGIAADGVKTADEVFQHYAADTDVAAPRSAAPRFAPPRFTPPARAAHPSTAQRPSLWIANDQCPPAPGCILPPRMPEPAASGTAGAAIWQYAQTPRRAEFTASCATTYSSNGDCHVPALPQTPDTAVDLNTATSPDPSHGR